MLKKVLFMIGVSVLCAQAHAGIWDTITGWFGSEESKAEAQATEVIQEAAPKEQTTNTATLIQKGVELIPLLTQTLGVSNGQAQGGMGAILQAAQVLLSGTEYGKLAGAIPNVSSLISAAPKLMNTEGKSNGLMDAALQTAAEHSDTVKAGSQLLSQFKDLGLSADMIPKFTQTTNDYLKQKGQSEAASLIQGLSL